MTAPVYLAADFGGGSGRVIAGWISGGRLETKEIHRFPNRQVHLGNHVFWDFPALFQDLMDGLRRAAAEGLPVRSIGIDTWGVDFGLIDRLGNLMGNPVCYRDSRTKGMPELFFQTCTPAQHYAESGIQVMEINTLFQLMSMQRESSPWLAGADTLLFMPDLFAFYLTGRKAQEYCIASTSELLDARKRTWNYPLLERLGLARLFPDAPVMPGTRRGQLLEEIAHETGLHGVEVVSVGSHDTASAVAAAPFCLDTNAAFLSSGTWSLLGAETAEPILTEEARQGGFTNEGGVGGRIRFLKNITGLWILQRLMAEWAQQGEPQQYATLLAAAAEVQTEARINPDAPEFMHPHNMERAVRSHLAERGMAAPATKAGLTRCVLQSLARTYAEAVVTLNQCLPAPIEVLHVIGGGSQNDLLNQLTANALGIPVIAGPVEATAMGNILVQAMAYGEIDSLEAVRDVVRNSVELRTFVPQ